ncbi:MAG: glycosyltransferase [Proteobacteria bacterium]|nr:glycosyltransferase [Pseudomonadota bacterium]
MARSLTVVQLLPALDAGGVERSTLEIAAALVAAGHRAIVVSAGGRMLPALRATGAEHIELDIGRKSPLTLRHARTLRKLFQETHTDIVHARSRLPAWMGLVALRGLRDRPCFVTTVHGLNSPGRYSGVMRRGQRVICVSQTVREHVLRQWPDTDPAKLVVIPRGVDPAAILPAAQPDLEGRERLFAAYPQLAGERVLLLPARGTRLKGHAHALELLHALRRDGIDARLLLAGVVQPGRESYLRELQARADALELREFVAFTEPLASLSAIYALSDLVLQLSDRPESFGRTVLEALSCGRPILGWDHGGVGELLRELCPAGAVALHDAAALAQRARMLLDAPRPAIALPDRYTLARMQADTLALYADLVDAQR